MTFPNPWKYTLNIKRFLTHDDVTPEIASAIIAELKKAEPFTEPDAEYILEELQDAGDDGDTRWFNDVLQQVYDYADATRVWLG